MLTLTNIHTFYGPIEALKGINIEVKQGEIVCLIGSNGAGKSTTLMTISGILKPSLGSIQFEGKTINGIPPHRIVKMGISQVPEGRRIFPKLTVKENLEMGAYTKFKVQSSKFKPRTYRNDERSKEIWVLRQKDCSVAQYTRNRYQTSKTPK